MDIHPPADLHRFMVSVVILGHAWARGKYMQRLFIAIAFGLLSLAPASAGQLSAAETKFLVSCGIPQSDIKVIPKISLKGQKTLHAFLLVRDCTLFDDFKQSREY